MEPKEMFPVKCIRLDYGADDPLLLEVDDDALVADCRGPEGVVGEAARQLVTAALASATAGPPLESNVVPGDRVAIGLTGDLPQAVARSGRALLFGRRSRGWSLAGGGGAGRRGWRGRARTPTARRQSRRSGHGALARKAAPEAVGTGSEIVREPALATPARASACTAPGSRTRLAPPGGEGTSASWGRGGPEPLGQSQDLLQSSLG